MILVLIDRVLMWSILEQPASTMPKGTSLGSPKSPKPVKPFLYTYYCNPCVGTGLIQKKMCTPSKSFANVEGFLKKWACLVVDLGHCCIPTKGKKSNNYSMVRFSNEKSFRI